MISGPVKRIMFFTACTECEYKNTDDCPHPYFESWFTQRKIKDVGCSDGKLNKQLKEETRNRREYILK